MKEKHVCCICKEEFTGFGNNPAPLPVKENDRCCDECNEQVIIPIRIYLLSKKKRPKKN